MLCPAPPLTTAGRVFSRLFRSNPRSHILSSASIMKYNKLGSSELLVSDVCLGTMTWGLQNTEKEAHEQIEYAISRGINFIDTAELYPVPTSAPDQVPGRTEEIIGSYIASNPGVREKLIIATKVVGYGIKSRTVSARYPERSEWPEGYPDARLDAASIRTACEASLKRLQTNYIDLYQLHWPDRYVPLWGERTYNPGRERDAVSIRETLLALKELLDSGKIRAYGLSNETTYGVCEFARIAGELNMPRPASIQNAFCLLNRQFEGELAEACAPNNLNIGLLPWSILGGGVLTGKYNGKLDSNFDPVDGSLSKARFVKFKSFQGRFVSDQTLRATDLYAKIAEEKGMSVATLAQSFCKSRWYIPSSIIGATTIEQLRENIDAFEIDLDADTLSKIDSIHNAHKDLCVSA